MTTSIYNYSKMIFFITLGCLFIYVSFYKAYESRRDRFQRYTLAQCMRDPNDIAKKEEICRCLSHEIRDRFPQYRFIPFVRFAFEAYYDNEQEKN